MGLAGKNGSGAAQGSYEGSVLSANRPDFRQEVGPAEGRHSAHIKDVLGKKWDTPKRRVTPGGTELGHQLRLGPQQGDRGTLLGRRKTGAGALLDLLGRLMRGEQLPLGKRHGTNFQRPRG